MNRKAKRKGYVLMATAVAVSALIGAAALAIDVSRLYIAKSEVQTYADSGALAAAVDLDGTLAGFTRAKNRVATNSNRRNFETETFTSYTLRFAKQREGPWEESPQTASGYKYTRVSAVAPVSLSLLPVFKSSTQHESIPVGLLQFANVFDVHGDSEAGQMPKNSFREGLFPFSPYVHSTQAPNYGLVAGSLYTFRWPASPRLNHNLCAGDNTQAMLNLAAAAGSEERGYIESTSADLIRSTIETDYQSVTRVVGESVTMTGGGKQAQRDSLFNRINQDSNTTARTYAEYVTAQNGNGRRIVAMLVNTGSPNGNKAVQVGAFFLRKTSEYQAGGNQPWCAEYIGSWVSGSKYKAVESSGAFVPKLVK